MSTTTAPPEKQFLALKLGDRTNVIVGELIGETPTEVVLHYPVMVNVFSDDEGHMNVATSKYFLFSDGDKVAFLKTTIASVSKPRHEFVQYYLTFLERYANKVNTEMELEILGIADKQSVTEEHDVFESDVAIPKVVH